MARWGEVIYLRVLLVEDEPGLIEFIRLELELQELFVDVATDGERALEMALQANYDLILLDVILPEMSGFDVCRAIRETSQVPIIMLTARGEVADRVRGLDVGADDYLVKPFAIEELLARMRALLRRRANTSHAGTTLSFSDVCVHLDTYRVTFKGQEVDLTAREYELLLFLLCHPQEVWSRQELLEHVWGFNSPGDTNVVDVYIGYLRQKVDPHKQHIRTVRGQGYRFEVTV